MTAAELADLVRPMLGAALVGFEVDGVLAPIVEHADDARLTEGVGEALERLAARTEVAILSGRSLGSLERLFAFPAGLHLVGSHGLEERDQPPVALDDDERYTFEQLEILGVKAVEAAGEGAWLEYKPASVVLHTRSAAAESAAPAVESVIRLAGMIDGAQVKAGHEVVELLARSASTGTALFSLAGRLERSPIVYLGDDITDEDVFRRMGDGDVSIRIGPGESAARHRLDSPGDVAELLDLLAPPSVATRRVPREWRRAHAPPSTRA